MSDNGTAIPIDAETGARTMSSNLKRFLPIAVIAAGLTIGYTMGWHRYLSLDFLLESRDMLKAQVAGSPFVAAAGFMGLYALAVAFSFPAASILTIFAGFLFGWLQGGLMVAFAATAGATAIFMAARSAFGDFLREKVGKRTKGLAEGFEANAFNYLLVLRLAPVFPFFIMNIAPALFNVPLRTYVAATLIGILPGTFAYAFLGQGLDSVIVSAQEAGREVGIGDIVTPQITLAFAALAAVAAIPAIVRKFRGQ